MVRPAGGRGSGRPCPPSLSPPVCCCGTARPPAGNPACHAGFPTLAFLTGLCINKRYGQRVPDGKWQMIGLLQRVSSASVAVDGAVVGAIGQGLLVLAAVRRGDVARDADRLAERLLGYRVFPDATGRMNRSLEDIGGELLLVPQFTLAADTRKGMRASFTGAAEPETGRQLFDRLVSSCRRQLAGVATGRFGADMQVTLVNDGPVTFWLES